MTNLITLEGDRREPRPDISGGFGERLILPPVVLPDFVAYKGNIHHPLHAFSLEVAHERGTFRGQVKVLADFSPLVNSLSYRNSVGSSSGGVGGRFSQIPVFTPFGDISIQYLISEAGFADSSEENAFQRLKPPIIMTVTLDGFKEGGGRVTQEFGASRQVCVVYAGGRVFGGNEGRLDGIGVQSGEVWSEVLANGSLNLDGAGLLYLPYDSAALSKIELSVTDPNQVMKSR